MERIFKLAARTENSGGQIWHHGVHAGVRCDITVSRNAGLEPFSRGSKVASTGFLPIYELVLKMDTQMITF